MHKIARLFLIKHSQQEPYNHSKHEQHTPKEESCSNGDDGVLRGREIGKFVEIVHRILEEERHLHIHQLQK